MNKEKQTDTQIAQEMERLRLQFWKARNRHSRLVGAAMLIFSAILLFLAYITRYLTFEVASIVSLVLGTILMLSQLEPHVRLLPATQAILSPIDVFIELKQALNVRGRGFFIPFDDGHVKLWIPKQDASSYSDALRHVDSSIAVNADGLLIPSFGRGLYRLYDEELNGIHGKDADYLVEWLPRVMVESLQVCEKADVKMNGDEVETVFTRPMVRHLCMCSEVKEAVCSSVGCPLAASIAEVLAESTGRLILHVSCHYDPVSQKARAVHRFGPSAKQ